MYLSNVSIISINHNRHLRFIFEGFLMRAPSMQLYVAEVRSKAFSSPYCNITVGLI